jgi:hypothetical protein
VVGTANATWYVTGVQIEAGSSFSQFQYRPLGQELALCQRYFALVTTYRGYTTTNGYQDCAIFRWPSPMRIAPAVTVTDTTTTNIGTFSTAYITTNFAARVWLGTASAVTGVYAGTAAANAEL